jgi:hypothetical protein
VVRLQRAVAGALEVAKGLEHGRGDKEAAKADLLRAFDEWLSKQKI